MMLGDAAKELTITREMFTTWEDDSATAAAIDAAAEKLKKILTRRTDGGQPCHAHGREFPLRSTSRR